MNNNLYLDVAGFNIEMVFHPIDNIHLRESFIEDIKRDYSGFIVKSIRGKVDFTIDFMEAVDVHMIYREKQKTYYYETIRYKKNNHLETFYRVGAAQFTFIFKQILLRILGQKNAFMLHTSAAKIGRYVYLFMAHSGGGKSTTMKFLGHKYQSLADDSVIIKKEGGKYYLYQTPMVEKEWWIKKSSQRYEIGALYFIQKAKTLEEKEFASKKDMMPYLMDQILVTDLEAKAPVKLIMKFAKEFNRFRLLYLPKDRDILLKFFDEKKYG